MKNLRILVVEDVSTMRNFIKATLESSFRNVFVDVAANGSRAKEMLESESFDIVLCDWDMPVMRGDELLQWIRETESLKEISFIMVTGKTQKDDVLLIKDLGADGYIVKPVTVGILIGKLAGIRKDLVLA
ncbi:MAG TPA: response regulator [Thermodesulfovibrionales bacterium]|nr:response regulator [Thermodesulfovibrionales bacterium]